MAKILVYVDDSDKAQAMERKPVGHGVDLAMATSMKELSGLLRSNKEFDLVILNSVNPHSHQEIKQTINKIKDIPVLFFENTPQAQSTGGGPGLPPPQKDAGHSGTKAPRKAPTQNKADAGIESARRFMDEHFYRQMSLEEIAEVAGISTSYFCRRFKEIYSLTPIAYLKELRIKRACHLLEHTKEPLSEITRQSGFFSIPYFCREFKKNMGMPPIEYRKQHTGKR
jgi:AraC-like DNA-binding protein